MNIKKKINKNNLKKKKNVVYSYFAFLFFPQVFGLTNGSSACGLALSSLVFGRKEPSSGGVGGAFISSFTFSFSFSRSLGDGSTGLKYC